MMTMNRKIQFLTMMAVLIGLTSCTSCKVSRWHVETSQASETRTLRGFERIELLGSLDVKYQQADSFSVEVSAPEQYLDKVETIVEGNRLVLRMKGDGKFINFGVSDGDGVKVYVTSPDLIGVTLRGSGDFECVHLVDTDNLDITLNGSGDIKFADVICDRVNVSLVGSGDVDMREVKTLWAGVSVVGSGDVKMRFENSGKVETNITGSGDITLKGTVSNYQYNVRGSGDMHTEELKITNGK
jgi:hypothetical protein